MTDISFSPTEIKLPSGHFLGGRLVTGAEDIAVISPGSGQLIATLPEAGAGLVDEAVRLAAKVQQESGWSTCAPRERARVLRRWADLVDQHKVELARLETVSSTRPIAETLAWDIPFLAEGIRFFAECCDKTGGEVAATSSDLLGMTIHEPYGVTGAIAPWNFPLVMASWKVVPALAAGNGSVLKPSEITPFSVVRLAELACEAGLPAGLFNVVQGTGLLTGDPLCRHPQIGKLSFTGSTRTGIAVMKAAAESGPKPVTLELGGKSPQLVFGDIPSVEDVADRIFRAFTGNAGQVCVTGSRLIVHRSVADQLTDALIERCTRPRALAPWNGEAAWSPIISATQADRILKIVSDSQAAGAESLATCARMDSGNGGAFLSPGILSVSDTECPAWQEEIFGPVLSVRVFDEEDEAFALAQHPVYGLAAGVHTASMSRVMRAIRTLKAGTVWINRYGRSSDFVIPTGGYGGSGIGKDLGRQAFEANLRLKSVLMAAG
ncbi:aldehyde dehydrogenase family protein [Acetobacter conturbans]|uniref:Aldehyde dehydrogenase family protein n=1 Tax=Acetobacter conturbans TaxID=1737472 RepID=A0ABX0JW76_9PROT|nr:aldehyde dehydrogenase family protein [Acetobacter conturbans]